MRLHKIPGVPLEVCCAEQKIAYNLAFRLHVNQGDEYLALPDECKSQAIDRLTEEALENYRKAYRYRPGKYNEDAIADFLKRGLARYLEKQFIAVDYERIGKVFL